MASKQKTIGAGLKNILKIKDNHILTEEVNAFAIYKEITNFFYKKDITLHVKSFVFGEDKDAAFNKAKNFIG